MFGRLGAGYAADVVGRWNVFIGAGILSGISVLAVWIPATNSAGAIGFSAFFGFASGAYVSLLGALAAAVSPLPEIGYRTGVLFLVISIPALTTAPIAGAILQHTGEWLNLKIFSGVMFMAGSAVIMVARVLYTDGQLLTIF
jgi:MFS family permease